jgi:hypothetical protein
LWHHNLVHLFPAELQHHYCLQEGVRSHQIYHSLLPYYNPNICRHYIYVCVLRYCNDQSHTSNNFVCTNCMRRLFYRTLQYRCLRTLSSEDGDESNFRNVVLCNSVTGQYTKYRNLKKVQPRTGHEGPKRE